MTATLYSWVRLKLRICSWLWLGALILAATPALRAKPLAIPNGSFESPATDFVQLNLNSWERGAKPDDYEEGGGFLWSQLTGIFKNPAPGAFDHLTNCDGNQALWFFAVPGVSLFQDYASIGVSETVPSHAFDVSYEVGKSYALSVGVNGGGGGMSNGVTIELRFFYRTAANERVVVASTTITNSPLLFPNHTELTRFETRTLPVVPTDPWAGKHLGIEIRSTVIPELQGGYWDIDAIELEEFTSPKLLDPQFVSGNFQLTLQSDPGSVCELLAGPGLSIPLEGWERVTLLTNSTGVTMFQLSGIQTSSRFYQARQISP